MNTKTIAYQFQIPTKVVNEVARGLGLRMEYNHNNRQWNVVEGIEMLMDHLAEHVA
jgi:hypothetical protein